MDNSEKLANIISNIVFFKGCISDPADVVFLLDSSASNSYYDFQKELQSVAEFAKFYVIGR
jgi:hypothetical protein